MCQQPANEHCRHTSSRPTVRPHPPHCGDDSCKRPISSPHPLRCTATRTFLRFAACTLSCVLCARHTTALLKVCIMRARSGSSAKASAMWVHSLGSSSYMSMGWEPPKSSDGLIVVGIICPEGDSVIGS